MSRPTVRVVGLGPADERFLTASAISALTDAPAARLRTTRHPAAAMFPTTPSYDELYENASSFEQLYADIVDDLVRLAHEHATVAYGVPGSPLVAEHTVELLRERSDIDLIVEPAVSVIDVAFAALGVDPMASGVRIVDALASSELSGPGPLLVLQTYSAEIMAVLADRLGPTTPVTVLFHLGLSDQRVETVAARELVNVGADHLTSVWVPQWRTAGVAIDELVTLTRVLREKCVWDQEQTHLSLLPHLVEEAYEALDAIRDYADGPPDGPVDHVVEELGDLLFQIMFHAELGVEEDRFDVAAIADAVHHKLVFRHPHVFGDVVVTDADDAARRWEVLKKTEKSRASVTDGIATELPSLTLYAKLRRKADAVGVERTDRDATLAAARTALDELAQQRACLPALVEAVATLAEIDGIDAEGELRARALALRALIRASEQTAMDSESMETSTKESDV